ncbi:MAG: lipocalin family protein [Candidatus Chlorobium antarcticum]|nr:lipocalin family protein [Candidatus Chlorobium antarcticum]
MIKRLMTFLMLLLPAGCTGIPEGLTVVEDFSLDRYLGTWYEIARIENSFEKNFEEVSATYSLKENGTVRVLNSGFDTEKNRWKRVEGKAKFVGESDRGALKVSFFGPFYAGYNILALDRDNYSWAIVSGHKRSLFWILAKTPEIEPSLLAELTAKAGTMGFETDTLHYVRQSAGEDERNKARQGD